MNVWHISDTHTKHKVLSVPHNIDIVIHSGDFSDSRKPDINRNEVIDFLEWFSQLKIKYKILVAGNHDTSIFHKKFLKSEIPQGINYLENDSCEIEGVKFWGGPQTPTFGKDWAWNVDRAKIHQFWDLISNDTDVIITHGPPLGILDKAERENKLTELTGDRALLNAVLRVKPQFHCFGHIHNSESSNIYNSGLFVSSISKTVFSNAACIEDRTGKIVSNGNFLCIRKNGTSGF